MMLVTIHRGPEHDLDEVLRVWRGDARGYTFVRELTATEDDESHLSAAFFKFKGELYLHLMTLHVGFAHIQDDELFRVARRSLTPIRERAGSTMTPTMTLAKGE
jgi:hypothetical protein